MDLFLLKLIAVVVMAALVVKRAIRGPQKVFARTSCFLMFAGVATWASSAEKDDFAINAGAVVLLAGMLVYLAMMAFELFHVVRNHRVEKSR